ncbi:MAG: pilus assembly PilX N-terminal domain-containing protein [Planctomycetes bacterium]|nr:pilus assembly PilX N-terminal domain-containing protein [Planctomycetota bacterium]
MGERKKAKGSVLVVVLIFTIVFSALAVGYLAAANNTLRMSRLYVDSRRAHFAAESGLELIRRTLPEVSLKGTVTIEDQLNAIAADLNARFEDTLFNGDPAVVDEDQQMVVIPSVTLSLPEGMTSMVLCIQAGEDGAFVVQSVGAASDCAQTVAMCFGVEEDTMFLANFGVASRSRISMTGNSNIEGANDSKEGSVLSTTYSYTQAVDLRGNIDVSGDISIANPEGEVRIVGHADIGGDVKIGVAEPEFPTIDVSPFEVYATTVVDSSTATGGNQYFENIRIAAGTNPTFSGNTTIRGVVYIESPNKVHFSGNLNLVGVIVCEAPEDEELDLSNHSLKFTGNTSTSGVEALPSGSQFDGLRDLGGAFILAEGYSLQFTGNFSTINGTMAASEFKFTGNAGGTIAGSLLCYDDTDFVMTGNSHLTFDHKNLKTNPPGLVFPVKLVCVGGSYVE